MYACLLDYALSMHRFVSASVQVDQLVIVAVLLQQLSSELDCLPLHYLT